MANPKPAPFSLEDTLYILNHVFLPPKLPQEDDTNTDHDIALCHLVYDASLGFTDFVSKRQQQKWSIVSQMLQTLLKTRLDVLDKRVLSKEILALREGGQSC